jgi:hypothetical protein
MKGIVCGALCILAITAQAKESVLPQDFFIDSFGQLRDNAEITELSKSSFELTQRFDKRAANGEALNFMSFCMASAIAVQRNFSGWTIGMSDTDPNGTSRVLEIVLLNSESDVQRLPTTRNWLAYKTPGDLRPTCSHFVNSKYLWPAGPSTTEASEEAKTPDVVSGARGDAITPWRQKMCDQTGSGADAVLTVTFENTLSKSQFRELKFDSKTLSAATELGKTTIPWKRMGSINTILASALHPDYKQPGYLIRLALPASVMPPEDFGVIDPPCQSKVSEFMARVSY